MDKDLQNILEENQRLLKKNLDISRENQKKIIKIQKHIRRTMWWKIMYWILIIGITAGAFYYVQPYFNSVVKSYNELRERLDYTAEVIENPTGIFREVDILQNLFGS